MNDYCEMTNNARLQNEITQIESAGLITDCETLMIK